jgi:SNF2 family DNA or RNA helicase
VFEALFSLRQAACHPTLIDAKRSAEPSAKLGVLFEQLEELLAKGHKALIFSQFTRSLALVRAALEQSEIAYAYLDGRTRDRAERVERFQSDPDCRVFAISLEAGGTALNLTAADYVFLLDPWWTPAVEAQAVDRAHRIGPTRPVMAYRLAAKDSVEEKIFALQRSKRELAESVLGDDRSFFGSLSREDLQLLLDWPRSRCRTRRRPTRTRRVGQSSGDVTPDNAHSVKSNGELTGRDPRAWKAPPHCSHRRKPASRWRGRQPRSAVGIRPVRLRPS